MEQSQKKSFLLYFDNYPCLTALSDVQRGKLMLLLFRYAMEADRHPVEPESFIEQEPDLPPETRMAFCLLRRGSGGIRIAGESSSSVTARQPAAGKSSQHPGRSRRTRR